MVVALACDHGGFELKEAVKKHLTEKGYVCKDFGAYSTDSVDYAPIAAKAAVPSHPAKPNAVFFAVRPVSEFRSRRIK